MVESFYRGVTTTTPNDYKERKENMSKKKNKHQAEEIMITSDDLVYVSDDDIRNLHDSLRKDRDYAVREGFNTKNFEVSLCYVQREMEIRDQRRSAHLQYMKEHGLPLIQQDTQDTDVPAAVSVLH